MGPSLAVQFVTSYFPRVPRTPAPTHAAIPVFLVALASFALAVVATAADGWPLPRAFDEFSYVLAGETFASGRLANPPYPVADALETVHVLQRPTYGSKYLPGHGLFLAVGYVLGAGPRLGQWLAFAVMGGAIFWMLAGWLSRRAALVTAALFVIALADSDWTSGYWGSSVAVAGSALIFGAIRRLPNEEHVRLGLLAGLGAIMLALTRPFEGLAAVLFPAAYLANWVLAYPAKRRRRLVRFALPCFSVIALGAGLLAAHNEAVTGNALRLAYAEYEKDTPGAPPFIWRTANAPAQPLRANQQVRLNIDLGSYRSMRSNWGSMMWSRAWDDTLKHYLPHFGFAGLFLLVPFTLRDRRLWVAVASVASVAAAVGVSSYYLPHYFGPALPPLLLLYAMAGGVLARLKWPGRRIGQLLVAGLALGICSLGLLRVFTYSPLERAQQLETFWTRQRAALATQVAQVPGKHVLFVRYAPSYKSQNEWVQNGANLAAAPVLWVHDLGDVRNDELMRMEAGRTPWLLTIHGDRPPDLTRYTRVTTAAGGLAP